MLLIKTCLLKKIGSTVTHWRQISLLMSSDREYLELKIFSGRSKNTLKQTEIHKYDITGLAHRDFVLAAQSKMDSGYEYIELLCIPAEGLILGEYLPPIYAGQENLISNLAKNDYIAIPVYYGQRVMIRIGCESVTSISAICCVTGKEITVKEHIQNSIKESLVLGSFENGIFEALLGAENITLIDAAFVNGVPINRNYNRRNSYLKSIFVHDDIVSVTNYKEGKSSLVDYDNEFRDLDVRAYLFKPENALFSASGKIDNACFIANNFYKINAEVGSVLGNKRTHDIIMLDNEGYTNVGDAAPCSNEHPIGNAIVLFTGIKNGRLYNAWLDNYDIDRTNVTAFKSQLDTLDSLWQGL